MLKPRDLGPAATQTVPALLERPSRVEAWWPSQNVSIVLEPPPIGLGRETDSEKPIEAMDLSMREPSETEHGGRVCRFLVAL